MGGHAHWSPAPRCWRCGRGVRRWIRFRPAAALLGVSVQVFEELVARGPAPAALSSTAGGHAGHWYFDSAVFTAWRDRLLAHATPLPARPAPAGAWRPLWRAVAVLHPIGWTTTILLDHIAAGTMPAYRAVGIPDRGLAALRFASPSPPSGRNAAGWRAAPPRRGWVSTTRRSPDWSRAGC
jgi:hypothetical protein